MSVDDFLGKLARIANGDEEQQFATVSKFMKELMVLPHANADTERVFLSCKPYKDRYQKSIEN